MGYNYRDRQLSATVSRSRRLLEHEIHEINLGHSIRKKGNIKFSMSVRSKQHSFIFAAGISLVAFGVR